MNRELENDDINLTIIGSDMSLTGDLLTSNDVRIDGEFYGELITSGKIVVSEDGYIEGKIRGVDIVIIGQAKGEFVAENNFQISPGGYFKGTIKTRYIRISDSAHFDGTCDISPGREDIETVHTKKNFDIEKKERTTNLQLPETKPEKHIKSTLEKTNKKPKESSHSSDDSAPPPEKQSLLASKIKQIKSI